MEISKGKVSRFAALKLKKHRDRDRLFVIEGEKSVADSFDCFEPIAVVATRQWAEAHPCFGHEILTASAADMRRISALSTAPQVLAVCRIPETEPSDPASLQGLVLLLDGVQDPGNLGTIVRSADWFGVHRIFASPATADIYSSKAVMATMGSLARVSIEYRDLTELVASRPDMAVCGLQLDGSDIYRAPELPRDAFVVMGNEGRGITPAMRRLVTMPLLIPSWPSGASTAESLNVAMATSLTLAEFRRRQSL